MNGFNLYNQAKFQSTLPCGSDLLFIAACIYRRDFNPRSLAGATLNTGMHLVKLLISIHAPLRERPIPPIFKPPP